MEFDELPGNTNSQSKLTGHGGSNERVAWLQEAITRLLSPRQRLDLIDSLDQYHASRKIRQFADWVSVIMSPSAQQELVPLICQIIPGHHAPAFLKRLGVQSPEPLSSSGVGSLYPDSDSNDNSGRFTGLNGGRARKDLLQEQGVRQVLLRDGRQLPGQPLGMTVKGGAEHGLSIFVTSVAKGSLADRAGVESGDEVTDVNGLPCQNLTHPQVTQLLGKSHRLLLTLKASGRVPGTQVERAEYKWVDPMGRPVSPPLIRELDDLTVGDVRKVYVSVDRQQSLGVTLRGGSEFGLGVYVSGVEPGSSGHAAGLKVGDEILTANKHLFDDITHSSAVKVLRTTRHMVLTVRDLGKLPYARVKREETQWLPKPANGRPEKLRETPGTIARSQSTRTVVDGSELQIHSGFESLGRHSLDGQIFGNALPTNMFSRGAGSQIMRQGSLADPNRAALDQRARALLNKEEQVALNEMLSQYSVGIVGIDGLVMGLDELLNTPSKLTLVSDVRNLLLPRDLAHYDKEVLSKEKRILPGVSRVMLSEDDDEDYDYDDEDVHETSQSIRPFSTDSQGRIPVRFQEYPGDISSDEEEGDFRDLSAAIDAIETTDSEFNFDAGNPSKPWKVPRAQALSMLASPQKGDIQFGSGLGVHSHASTERQPRVSRGSKKIGKRTTPNRDPQHENQLITDKDKTMCSSSNGGYRVDSGVSVSDLSSGGLAEHNNSLPQIGMISLRPEAPYCHEPSPRTNRRVEKEEPRKPEEGRTMEEEEIIYQQPKSRPRTPPTDYPRDVGVGGGVRTRDLQIKKVRGTFGLAVEGGAETKQPLPRVVSVQPGGSAWESGEVRTGQVVSAVDGVCLSGLEHAQAARVIADAFQDRSRNTLVLTVLD